MAHARCRREPGSLRRFTSTTSLTLREDIVDDPAHLRYAATKLLAHQGFKLRPARSAQPIRRRPELAEAIRGLAERSLDLGQHRAALLQDGEPRPAI